jgi:hypothetical protein
MLKRLAMVAVFGTLLLGGPSMAKNQQGQPDAKHGDAAKVNAPVPPTHVIVDKLPSVEHSATKPGDTAKAPEEKPLPRFARPEWVIVYITAIYVVIAAVTLIAIWRQADLMKTQAGWMQEQTGRMSRQADLMNRQIIFAKESLIVARDAANAAKESAEAAKANADAALAQVNALKSKERAKLSFELEPFSPYIYFRSTPWAQTVDWRVRLHGQSEAWEVRSPVILCIGEPTTHLFAGFSTLNLPEIMTPAQREYSGKIVLNYQDSSRVQLGEDLEDRMKSGDAILFCAGSIEYTDVYGDRWVLLIRKRWIYHATRNEAVERMANSTGGFWFEEGDNREKKKES